MPVSQSMSVHYVVARKAGCSLRCEGRAVRLSDPNWRYWLRGTRGLFRGKQYQAEGRPDLPLQVGSFKTHSSVPWSQTSPCLFGPVIIPPGYMGQWGATPGFEQMSWASGNWNCVPCAASLFHSEQTFLANPHGITRETVTWGSMGILCLSGTKALGTGTGTPKQTCFLHRQTQLKSSAPFSVLKLVIFNSPLVFE